MSLIKTVCVFEIRRDAVGEVVNLILTKLQMQVSFGINMVALPGQPGVNLKKLSLPLFVTVVVLLVVYLQYAKRVTVLIS